jgi:hypothetical protein
VSAPSEIRDRRDASGGHILIGGPGRAGTTVLVQYFTALGFDTGFDLDTALTRVDPISRGGLEHSLGRTLGRGVTMPYVSKSPYFDDKLGPYLASGELRVSACIIPMRHLQDAAESRRRASERAAAAGLDYNRQAGGMQRGFRDVKQQRRQLGVKLYQLVWSLVEHDVPIYFLPFPRFIGDADVLYDRLEPVLQEHGVTRSESAAALARVADPSLVHRSEPEE